MNTKTITKCVAILLLAMLTMPAFSQLRFGVRAEVGLNNPTSTFTFVEETTAQAIQSSTSFSVGGTMEVMNPLTNFGTEISLLYHNYSMSISGRGVIDRDYTNHYLLLPINVKKRFGLGVLPAQLFATAGPYVGFLLSDDDTIKRKFAQAGIGLGFSVEVLRRLQVGVQYRFQLTDNYDEIWDDNAALLNNATLLNDRRHKHKWNLSATFFF